MNQKSVLSRTFIIVGIIFVVNLLISQLYFRLDFTQDQRYTLSQATKDIISDLPEVVTVTAYFSENLPPEYLSHRKDFEDELIEYEKQSGGNVVYTFINPNETPEDEQKAVQAGIYPLTINIREEDRLQQIQGFMGAVVEVADKKEIIPYVQPGAAMEYLLTTSIKKILPGDKPTLAFLQGHNEAKLSSLPQLSQQLSVLYNLIEVHIDTLTKESNNYRSLIIIDPKTPFSETDLATIETYRNTGNGVFLSYATLRGDLQNARLEKSDSLGLSTWLEKKGLTVGDDYLIDINAGTITVQQQNGMFSFQRQIPFPYFPVVSNFADHITTGGLEALILPFVSYLSFSSQDTKYQFKPLLLSSDQTGLETPPISPINIERDWQEGDFTLPRQTISGILTETLSDDKKAHIVVIPNSDFIINGEGDQAQQLTPDNVNFVSNVVDWLSDDTGLVDLRIKSITQRPLDPVGSTTRTIIKYSNAFGPIILILLYALYRRQLYRRKKQNWMEDKI